MNDKCWLELKLEQDVITRTPKPPQKCSVTEQDVHSALLSGDPQDQLVIAYNLVVDNKRIADETAKIEIREFFLASSPPTESFMMVRLSMDV